MHFFNKTTINDTGTGRGLEPLVDHLRESYNNEHSML